MQKFLSQSLNIIFSTLTLIYLFLFIPASASPDIHLQIIETDPASTATLGYWEQFYLRIRCDTSQPIQVVGKVFSNGHDVTNMNSGSAFCTTGSNEKIIWFAFTNPMEVDQIILTATDIQSNFSLAQINYPVHLTWTGQKSTIARTQAAWIKPLEEERNREFADRINQSTPGWANLLGTIAIESVPLYFILQIGMLIFMRGKWRIAAAIPLIPMSVVIIYTVFAFLAGSNLFPLVLIFISPFMSTYLLIVLIRWGYLAWRNR